MTRKVGRLINDSAFVVSNDVCVYVCVCVYMYIYISMCVCVCVCMFIYVCVYGYVCVCVCVYMYICWLVVWVLWHINLCRLFNVKSIFKQIISCISINSI